VNDLQLFEIVSRCQQGRTHSYPIEDLENAIVKLAAQVNERDRSLGDIAKYTESRGLYVEKQVRAVDSVIPILMLLRREDAGDCWRLYRETLEAEHLPTPEEALKALGFD
jgi:hypothetical protein